MTPARRAPADRALARLGQRMTRTFEGYRAAIEQARDPDESPAARTDAWSRAAKQRARLETMFRQLGEPA